MADSSRFEELQKASVRDVKAVGMVSASTGLEMVEYIRETERRLNMALAAYAQICPFALNYADGGGSKGPEMRTYRRAEKMYDAAAEYYDGELDDADWPEDESDG